MSDSKLARLRGDTFRFREILREKRWRWHAEDKVWELTGSWKDEAAVLREVRGYAGIRNRGNFDIELVEL